ncbi:hypothetical protein HHK36_013843 [Tetracentron sinense]|uniref:Longin domain-containing protein n=1 Tax=Tetracentron sinense TaxID=13715 RepID=A0A834Z437_TETSI|nr:hypothetical protein HHK36_013843 [Tetracentron sinense]
MKITARLVLKCNPDGSDSDPIILANAYDVSHLGYFQRTGVKYKVHSYNREGLCVLGFMDDHYPMRSAFYVLDKVLDEYQKNFGDSWRAAQADATQPWPYLNEAVTKFQYNFILV